MGGTSPKGGARRSDRAAPRSGLDEAAADGVADESGRLVNAQLRHDARPGGLGGFSAASPGGRAPVGGSQDLARGEGTFGGGTRGVEDRDVGMGSPPQPDRPPAVPRLAHDLESLVLEHGLESLSNDLMVIGQKDLYRHLALPV